MVLWTEIKITLNLAKSLANFFRLNEMPENKKEESFSILGTLIFHLVVLVFLSGFLCFLKEKEDGYQARYKQSFSYTLGFMFSQNQFRVLSLIFYFIFLPLKVRKYRLGEIYLVLTQNYTFEKLKLECVP